jgi:phosphate transport system substrate-binding protein
MNHKRLALALPLLAGIFLAACAAPTPATVKVDQTVVVTATAAAPAAPVAPPLPAGSVQINAAGATFPLPLYQQWVYAFQYVDPSVVINYQGIGSGAGKKAIIDGTVDFAGSDSLVTDAEYASGKDLQMYPMVAGAVVPIYNIKWAKDFAAGAKIPTLVLTRQTLVDIYNGKVKKWNDASILATNPDLKDYLPAADITTVHRSDSSGTTELFTKSLTAFSTDWKAGGASTVQWPVGQGGKGNQGVAAVVIGTTNSIGYVELAYAKSNGLSYAALVNKAGKTVAADGTSLASAITDFASALDATKLTATIVDAPGAGSWPIAGYTYLVLHTTSMKDCVKAQKILAYIHWTLTDAGAAKAATTLGYSVLPDAVRAQVAAKLGTVTCNGKPVVVK